MYLVIRILEFIIIINDACKQSLASSFWPCTTDANIIRQKFDLEASSLFFSIFDGIASVLQIMFNLIAQIFPE